jgi:hypothetical protein
MRAASDPLFRCREPAWAECRVRFDLAVLGEIHSDFPGGLSAIVILGSSPMRVTHLNPFRSLYCCQNVVMMPSASIHHQVSKNFFGEDAEAQRTPRRQE